MDCASLGGLSYSGFTLGGVQVRLWKIPPYFSYSVNNFRAGTLCRWPTPKAVQNGSTARRVFGVGTAHEELVLVSRLKDSPLY